MFGALVYLRRACATQAHPGLLLVLSARALCGTARLSAPLWLWVAVGGRFRPLPARGRDHAPGRLAGNPPTLEPGRSQVRSTFPDHSDAGGLIVRAGVVPEGDREL